MNIGQAAASSGVSTKMIRYYESIDLIDEAHRTASGYRQYSDTEIQTLRFIKRSRDLGFSIHRIRDLLSLWKDHTRKRSQVKKLVREYIVELDLDIAKMQSIRQQLQHMADSCRGDHRPDCPIIYDLAKVTVLVNGK